jgi:TonB family protein
MATGFGNFTRDHQRLRPATSSRAMTVLLTALLFGCFAFLYSQRSFWRIPDSAFVSETVMRLMPDAPRILHMPPPEPVIAHLVRPRAETIAPPSFTIAAEAAPTPLSATASKTSPLDGGAPGSLGAQIASATGGTGADSSLSTCLDPVWMRAVTDHVRHYFYQPQGVDRFPITGLVYVHFIVAKDGSLLETSIGKTSGNRRLNDAALEIMDMAAPLPAIPDRMHADKIEGLLPIAFGAPAETARTTVGNCHG